MVLGAVLLLSALSLFLYNQYEAKAAEKSVEMILPQLIQKIEEQQDAILNPSSPTQAPSDDPAPPVDIPEKLPEPTEPVSYEMTEVEIDGNWYIGCLQIPSRGLELPVMSDWDYPKLKIAPCRYTGTVKGENLVIMAHNFDRHFGPLHNITIGERVYFVDMDGITTAYEVVALDILSPTSVEEVTSGDSDLTLFTCTYGGQSRVTVYCDMVEAA